MMVRISLCVELVTPAQLRGLECADVVWCCFAELCSGDGVCDYHCNVFRILRL